MGIPVSIRRYARDLLFAMRSLRQTPWFLVGIIAILGLGIGANTAVFSIVDAVVLRPLPYRSASRLVSIEETSPKRVMSYIPARNYLFFWAGRSDLFEKTIPYRRDVVTLTNAGAPDQVFAVRTSAICFRSWEFPLFGPDAGRFRRRADAPNAAVLSARLWKRLFHSDPGAIGYRLRFPTSFTP